VYIFSLFQNQLSKAFILKIVNVLQQYFKTFLAFRIGIVNIFGEEKVFAVVFLFFVLVINDFKLFSFLLKKYIT